MSAQRSLPGALSALQRWMYDVLGSAAQPRNGVPCHTVMSRLGLPGSWCVRPKEVERWASSREAAIRAGCCQ